MDNKFYERLSDEKREELLVRAIINHNLSEIKLLSFFIPLEKMLRNPKEANYLAENGLIWEKLAATLDAHNICSTKALLIYKMACIAINKLYYHAGVLSVQVNAHDIEHTKSIIKAHYEGFKRFSHVILKLDADCLLESFLITFPGVKEIKNSIENSECREAEIEKINQIFTEIWDNLKK